jgi:hypothetical protein
MQQGRHRLSDRFVRVAILGVLLSWAMPAAAQITPAAGYTPPDDTPSIRIGATIFLDYTVTDKPKSTDADGNEITPNAFNVGRAYLNVTGNINHRIAFRVTPDIVRESGSGSSVAGSYILRLKYAYGQFNFDDWMTRGSWARFGMQQTPWIDYDENAYRYRFQGTVFADREGYLSSSDVGASFHYNLPGNYGDLHGGFYNGETYSRPEVNDQKAFQIRGTLRPLPRAAWLRGLRVSGFYDHDAYVKDAERRRAIAAANFESAYLNLGFEYLSATDQQRAAAAKVDGRGFSTWITPKAPSGIGWGGLLRFDHLEPNTDTDATRNRTIAGISYWFPHQGSVATVLLFDVENVSNDDFAPARPDERRFAVHALINF